MAAFLSRRWKQQPSFPVVIDENHQYAAYIEAAFLPSVTLNAGLYNAVRRVNAKAVRDGTASLVPCGGQFGVGYRTSTAAFEYAYTVSGVRSTAGSHKNISFVLNRVASGQVAFANFAGDDVRLNGSSQPEIHIASTIRATGTAITTQMPLILGFSYKDSQYRIYQNGQRTADGVGGFGSGSPLSQLGGVGGGLNSAEQDVAFVLYGTDIEFDANFQAAFNDNPWHVLSPLRQRIYVNVAAAAGGGPFPHYTRRMLTGGMPVGVM